MIETSGGVVLLGILVGGLSPGSPNPDPISDKKWVPYSFAEIMSPLLRLKPPQIKIL